MWSVHLKYKPSEREVRIQELKKQMKEKGKKYFPHYKVIPLFPIIKLYHAHKVFAYSDISIVARQSGFSARQWPQIVPFSNSISFLLLPWVYFWLNQAKSEACCLNIPLHFMSESQNSFKRSHLTQKINHDGHCINHALLLFPSTVHDIVRNTGFQAWQIGQGDKMNLQKYIRYKHRGCSQIC